MKKAALYLLLPTALATTSCKKETVSADHNLFVDIQYGFDNDQVAVFIDGQQVFNNSVTSNPSLGWATSLLSSIEESGAHIIKVVINNQHTYPKVFSLNKDTWLGVGYFSGPVRDIKVIVSDKPFAYD